MLYVFYGSQTEESGKKARTLVESLRKKKPDATFEKITSENWNISALQSHIQSQGLFSSKYLIFVDRVLENVEAKESLSSFLQSMQESENIFIILEGKVNVDTKKAFEKHAEKTVVTDEKENKFAKKEEFNIFSLADSFGAGDRFRSWSIYRKAIDLGNEPEGIIGTLFWQVKSMVQAAGAKSATEAGLSPFVFSKAKKYSGNYSTEVLNSMLRDLVSMYHEGHRGRADLELQIEMFLLRSHLG